MIDDGIPGDAPRSGRVGAWLSAIERAYRGHDMAKYNERCRKIRRRYRYESSSTVKSRKYQLLWSNIETMKNAVYAKPPHATVSRRYRDADQTARVAAEILERATNFTFDAADFDSVFKQVRDDYLLYGRGVARVYYEPEYETKDDLNEDITDALSGKAGRGKEVGEVREGGAEGEGEKGTLGGRSEERLPQTYSGGELPVSASAGTGENDLDEAQTVAFENIRIRFVQRSDFRHQPARTWSEVQWLAFRAYLTRAEVIERFGKKIGKEINLDSDPVHDENERAGPEARGGADAKATIWEIWDKAKNKVLWIAVGWPDVLEEGPPYLELDGFYPCPMPAYGTLTTDSLVPVPDYVFYYDQCEEIDQLTARIGALSDALKLVGFYPGGPSGDGVPEIEKAFSAGFENKMIAVQSWAAFKEGGGGQGAPVVFLPVEQVLTIVEGCIKLRQQLVEDVYQIIGLSDIMRGASDPRETEGAQQLKAQFGGTRIRNRQQEIARFCRDIGRLVGQIIATYCQPATIAKMTNITLATQSQVMQVQLQAQQQAQLAAMSGQPPPPPLPAPGPTQEEVFGLLKDQLNRRFKIDIENDSTISGDESQERKDRQEFIVAITNFMEAWGPMTIQKPELTDLAGQVLLFGVRGFRIGRELEEVIEETVEKLKASGQSPQQDTKQQVEQIKLQGTQMKTQAEVQAKQIDAQAMMAKAQLDMRQAKDNAEYKLAELQMKYAMALQEHQHKMAEGQMNHAASVDQMHMNAQQHAQSMQQGAQKSASGPSGQGLGQVKINWPTKQPGF